jgi:hypothetical protein
MMEVYGAMKVVIVLFAEALGVLLIIMRVVPSVMLIMDFLKIIIAVAFVFLGCKSLIRSSSSELSKRSGNAIKLRNSVVSKKIGI